MWAIRRRSTAPDAEILPPTCTHVRAHDDTITHLCPCTPRRNTSVLGAPTESNPRPALRPIQTHPPRPSQLPPPPSPPTLRHLRPPRARCPSNALTGRSERGLCAIAACLTVLPSQPRRLTGWRIQGAGFPGGCVDPAHVCNPPVTDARLAQWLPPIEPPPPTPLASPTAQTRGRAPGRAPEGLVLPTQVRAGGGWSHGCSTVDAAGASSHVAAQAVCLRHAPYAA